MKILIAGLFLFLSVAVHAATVTLPEPTVQSMSGAYCGAYSTPNDVPTIYARQSMTGWSADGRHVYAQTRGSYPCGNRYGGRGLTYFPWCGTFTWTVTLDAFGNLNPISVATFTSTPGACGDWSQWNTGQTLYNSLGYGVTMTTEPLTYGYSKLVATLITP